MVRKAGEKVMLPALTVLCLLCGLRARINVYEAFVQGAKSGFLTLVQILPALTAILTATALLRETGLMESVQQAMAPFFSALHLPEEAAGVLLLRPLSGSASVAAVSEVIARTGADSRAARFCCVVSGASETVFFTASLYFSGIKRTRYAIGTALFAYVCGVWAAAMLV